MNASTGSSLFQDQQEFGDFVRSRIGMEYGSYQLVSGTSGYACAWVHFEDEGIWVARTRPLQDEFTEFVVPRAYLLVSVCRDPVEVFCNRWRVDMQPVLLFPGGQKVRGVFPLGYEAFDILLPLDRLKDFGVHDDAIAGIIALEDPLICEIASAAAQQAFAVLSGCFSSIATSSESNTALHTLFQQLGERISHLLEPGLLSRQAASAEETRRADIVAAASSYLDGNLASSNSIERMASDIGVSSRLLNYAFQDALGVSPYQFVLLKRLHHARDAIRLSSDAIGDIAGRYGFTTPSRFRSQYARLFGELPGETRRQRQNYAEP